ncbi:hypothetical protein [Spongiimicrobium salis]|uniref:hypothetical protein n=1 Tax=Spongiimicrobium salis TaxID=1667022 RepID=UPI00374CA8CE
MNKMEFWISIIVFITLSSCNIDNCSDKLPLDLDYHLFQSIKVEDQSYCDLVNAAFLQNQKAIRNLSILEISDFASYQHGVVLITLLDEISEEKYFPIYKSLNVEQKKYLISNLEAGMELLSNKIKYEDIQSKYPLILEEYNRVADWR